MSTRKVGSPEDAQRVWDAWVSRQPRPGACRYTTERQTLIRRRLGLGYSADDLVAMIRWVWEADERGPRWLRGENPDRATYLDLEALLRETKLGARVTAALVWAAGGAPSPPPDRAPRPPSESNVLELRAVRGGRSR